MEITKIGIIGEFNPGKKSHIALNNSLEWLKNDLSFKFEWIDTIKIERNSSMTLNGLSGIWSASGSPFKSLDGVIKAIEYARANNIPHLGTCGGFQHTILEYARNVLGIKEAQHEEYDKDATILFIKQLTCSLAGKTMSITIKRGSKTFKCYNNEKTTEDYYCNFGINPEFKNQLEESDLFISGVDQDGEIRIVEIPTNDFFIATLFVPHTKSTKEKPHPIIKEFVKACIKKRTV